MVHLVFQQLIFPEGRSYRHVAFGADRVVQAVAVVPVRKLAIGPLDAHFAP